MANSGGGYIVIGVDKNFNKKGMDSSLKIDEADLRNKINKYFDPKIEFLYREVILTVNGEKKKFGILYIFPSDEIVIAKTPGNYSEKGKTKSEFNEGAILIREGSKSRPVGPDELRKLLDEFVYDERQRRLKRAQSITKILERLSKPEILKEKIVGNFFEVKKLPSKIWYSETYFPDKSEVISYLTSNFGEIKIPPFILKENMIFTFSDLTAEENILRNVINVNEISYEITSSWFDDINRRRYLVELLNVTIREFCIDRGLTFDWKSKRYYFPAIIKGVPRKFEWRKGKRTYKRTVVYCRKERRGVFYLHRATRIKFTLMGKTAYLIIDPCYVFTLDGENIAKGEKFTALSTKTSNKQYNDLYLNDLIFWMTFLKGAGDSLTIKGLGFEVVVDGNPVSSLINVGIGDKRKTPEKEFEEKELIDASIIEEVFTELGENYEESQGE
jgi:hypothetical protein